MKHQYHVDANGCWRWRGPVDSTGYGWLGRQRAHRAFYALQYGSIPEGKQINHTCDVRDCVNPSHLVAGDQLANVADMIARNRQCKGEDKPTCKLTREDVHLIRGAYGDHRSIAARFGVSHTVIGQIKRREKWRHV